VKLPTTAPFAYDFVVLGGGAAGFFAAVNAARIQPTLRVLILEKTDKLLAKVRISGGGRCNLTHACFDVRDLVRFYPRGQKELTQLFARFNPVDTVAWFESRGVKLKTEADGRMFPVSDDSGSVVDCLLREANRYGVEIRLKSEVESVKPLDKGFLLQTPAGKITTAQLLIATGGHPKKEAYAWLEALGHSIVTPVPSLFTFNLPKHPITALMGVALPQVRVRLPEFKQEQTGPLLITHWGLSGPVVLKLSALAARELAAANYRYRVQLCWLPEMDADLLREMFAHYRKHAAQVKVINRLELDLPSRLKAWMLERAGILPDQRWQETSNKQINRFIDLLLNDVYDAQGKTTFKEEFVTSGGVNRKEIDFRTMESRVLPGLYFAGEVIDIDALTGGFNFQAAWSAGWVVANSIHTTSTNQTKAPTVNSGS
jgi:predicted Rossmann fold flavoprotein